jgi:predicted nucleotidyltransferase
MRLSPDQILIIQSAVQDVAGAEAAAWVYGSRLDETRRGGDVDLLVRSSPQIGLLQRARLKNRLEAQLGLPVDVVAAPSEGALSPFVRIALAQGVRL